MSAFEFKPQPLAYTLEGAAEATGLSLSVIKQSAARGEITRRYYGRKPVILATDLLAFLESLPYEPPGAVRP
ncbi:hypothetical protein [Leifsonia poae]|uniref:hypothetical protein n=1 Tax=Leifsonia poae TaxID=110933 RepID=UPI003D66BF45